MKEDEALKVLFNVGDGRLTPPLNGADRRMCETARAVLERTLTRVAALESDLAAAKAENAERREQAVQASEDYGRAQDTINNLHEAIAALNSEREATGKESHATTMQDVGQDRRS